MVRVEHDERVVCAASGVELREKSADLIIDPRDGRPVVQAVALRVLVGHCVVGVRPQRPGVVGDGRHARIERLEACERDVRRRRVEALVVCGRAVGQVRLPEAHSDVEGLRRPGRERRAKLSEPIVACDLVRERRHASGRNAGGVYGARSARAGPRARDGIHVAHRRVWRARPGHWVLQRWLTGAVKGCWAEAPVVRLEDLAGAHGRVAVAQEVLRQRRPRARFKRAAQACDGANSACALRRRLLEVAGALSLLVDPSRARVVRLAEGAALARPAKVGARMEEGERVVCRAESRSSPDGCYLGSSTPSSFGGGGP